MLKLKLSVEPRYVTADNVVHGDIIQDEEDGELIICGDADRGISLTYGNEYVIRSFMARGRFTLVPKGTEFVLS